MTGNQIKELKALYLKVKNSIVGSECVCPSCKAKFIKESYQQNFCKTKPKTQCKDKYWNNVTTSKRNNTTRISPANDMYMRDKGIGKYREDWDYRWPMGIDEGPEGWDGHKEW